MTTVALYARVSTKDKGQSTENQLPELRRSISDDEVSGSFSGEVLTLLSSGTITTVHTDDELRQGRELRAWPIANKEFDTHPELKKCVRLQGIQG